MSMRSKRLRVLSALAFFATLSVPAFAAVTKGVIDRVESMPDGSIQVRGWACAIGRAQPINVDLYLGAAAPTGTMKGRALAQLDSEAAVATACGVSTGNFRFKFVLPASFRSSFGGQKVYVHAINPDGGPNPLLSASGTMTLPLDGAPTVTAFELPAEIYTSTVPIKTFTAKDDFGVVAYLITESSAKPAATGAGWQTSAPASHTLSQLNAVKSGSKSLYAWVKDVAGNISAGKSATTTLASTRGNLESARLSPDQQVLIKGWACAMNNANPVQVKFYVGSSRGESVPAGATIANLASETAVGTACLSGGNTHRFQFLLSSVRHKQFANQRIYAEAIHPNGDAFLIGGSGNIRVPGDLVPPAVVKFMLPSTSESTTVTISALHAEDAFGVTGFMVTNSLTAPAAGAPGWTPVPPAKYVFPELSYGTQYLYAWAKDAAGNVSAASTGITTILRAQAVRGRIESVTKDSSGTVTVKGWACAKTTTTATTVNVKLYAGPATGSAPADSSDGEPSLSGGRWAYSMERGATIANRPTSSPAAITTCGGASHGFEITLGAALSKELASERIYVRVSYPDGGHEPVIEGSGSFHLPFDYSVTPPDRIRVARTAPYMIGTYLYPGWTKNSLSLPGFANYDAGWASDLQWPTIVNPHPFAPGADLPKRPLINSGAYNGLFYDDSDRNAVDWMIKWSLESGVSLFVYDWYWTGDRIGCEYTAHNTKALERGFLQSKYLQSYAEDIHFAIMWSNHQNWAYPRKTSGTCPTPESLSDRDNSRAINDDMIRYASEHYFNLPQYLKVEGKPVFIIFDVDNLKLGLTGEEGLRELSKTLERWQQIAVSKGLKGIYFVHYQNKGATPPADLLRAGIHGLSAYSYHGRAYEAATIPGGPLAGTAITGSRWRDKEHSAVFDNVELMRSIPYDFFTETYKAQWEKEYRLNSNFIPVVSPGWDNSPWKCLPETAGGRTAYSFKCMGNLLVTHPESRLDYRQGYKDQLSLAKNFVDTHATIQADTPHGPRKLILNEAWDEWGEGSVLAPTERWGFALLDAIEDVFVRRFVAAGNSITIHGKKEDIGWLNSNGMAASAPAFDYAHRVSAALNAPLQTYSIVAWEWTAAGTVCLDQDPFDYLGTMNKKSFSLRAGDILVIKLGENVKCITSDFADRFAKLVHALTGGQKIPVFIVTTLWGASQTSSPYFRNVAMENGYYIVEHEPTVPEIENALTYSNDAVRNHPNDLGMKKIADAVLKAMDAAGIPRK